MDEISELNLRGVLPELVAVIRATAASCPIKFRVIDGVRTLEEQKRNLAKGVSQTMNSMHLVQRDGYSHAIDFVVLTNGKIDWHNIGGFLAVVAAAKQEAKKQGLRIRCGADWKTLKDYGHIEVPL